MPRDESALGRTLKDVGIFFSFKHLGDDGALGRTPKDVGILKSILRDMAK
jgi:hypothetical protein